MFGRRIRLFSLLGFEVRIDLSWFFLGVLIAWSLAEGLFPSLFPGMGSGRYWVMALFGVVGLLLSIVLHEFSHSLVARRYGMPIDGITLFIFGGVAEMEDEPPNAKTEFLMAIAGPVASLLIAWLCFQLTAFFTARELSTAVIGVTVYLGYLNLLLALFNVLPAFPLDGGRVLRSILWAARKDIDWATRVASRIGAGFGWALVGGGIWFLLQGNLVGGMWWILIGLFLRGAAYGSYRQLALKNRLRGTRIVDIMNHHPLTVPASAHLDELLQRYAPGYHQRLLPVVDGDRLIGCVDAMAVKRIPRDRWAEQEVREITRDCPIAEGLDPESEASRAIGPMSRRSEGLLMFVEAGVLRGTLSAGDLLHRLSPGSDDRGWRA